MSDESDYPRVFFLMHKWIMESEYLSHMLYDLYKHYNDDLKKAVNSHEQRQYKDLKLRVCQAYRYVDRSPSSAMRMFLLVDLAVIGSKIFPSISILTNV